MTRRRQRRRQTSPAAPDNDDLIDEILLRLPSQPSSLPRASLVCKQWRRLVSDRGFLHRFRARHRDPPLLGVFKDELHHPVFRSVLDPPDLIPPDRFALRLDDYRAASLLGCRHGLVLIFKFTTRELLVWDPVSGARRRVAVPPELAGGEKSVMNGAVLCAAAAAGDDGFRSCHFKVVLIGSSKMDGRIFASVYSSATGEWGDAIFTGPVSTIYHFGSPAILVGNALYWLLSVSGHHILEFNLETSTLAVTDGNWPETNFSSDCRYCIMRGEDDNVGLAILSYRGFQMWERKVTLGGAARWVLRKTVKLHDILGLSSAVQREKIDIVGYVEDTNAFILVVDTAFYMFQVDSMQSKKLFDCNVITRCHPFTSFYTAVTGELVTRFISFLMSKYSRRHEISEEKQLKRLQQFLLRVSMVVEEADGRYITNSGMLMQLKALADAMYRGHHVLDMFRCRTLIKEDPIKEVSNPFPLKRFCKIVDASGKDKAKFVVLLGGCDRMSGRPYDTYLYIDNFMFGRHTEKQRLLNFLLEYNPPGVQPAVLPIIGALGVGKKTLVAHVCADERVQSQFSSILHLNEGDLLGIAHRHTLLAGNILMVVEFVSDVNEMNWEEFYKSVAQMEGS
uniref:F-box domain-containing protein n=1 Tax=Oryza glumipatula TaxID=40148 RepID=A0A0E0B7P1_9ORYZ